MTEPEIKEGHVYKTPKGIFVIKDGVPYRWMSDISYLQCGSPIKFDAEKKEAMVDSEELD